MFKHSGLRIFLIIWVGQVVSMLGSGMTSFALTIWAYEQTGQATTLALLGFFSYISMTAVGLFSGVWVDRWDRRKVMIFGDLLGGLVTVTLFTLYSLDALRIWHLYAGQLVIGVSYAFQGPAYFASMSLLIPREHLSRANGLRTLGSDMSQILAPIFAAVLLHAIHLRGVMLLDLRTLIFAVGTLLFVRIPKPPVSDPTPAGSSRWEVFTFGMRYIVQRRGLLYMMFVYMMINFYAGLTWFGVLSAMVLSRSGGNEGALSAVQSALGIGGVLGGIVLTIWGGPKRQVHGMLGIAGVSFLLGDGVLGLGRTPTMWIAGALLGSLSVPYIISSNRTIWQSKIPAEMQGRVIGTALTLQSATTPIGYLIAGPLADQLLDPALQPGGALTSVFGPLVGTGPGAGMGVMFLLTALAGATTCLSGYLFPALRNVERNLPDAVVHAEVSPDLAAAVGD